MIIKSHVIIISFKVLEDKHQTGTTVYLLHFYANSQHGHLLVCLIYCIFIINFIALFIYKILASYYCLYLCGGKFIQWGLWIKRRGNAGKG